MGILKYTAPSYDATTGEYSVPSSATWTDLPTPSKFTFNLADIDADTSGRLEDGTMSRNVLTTKRNLSLEWPALSNTEISSIYSAIQTTPGTPSTYFFCLEYPDAATGSTRQGIFYCGDRSTPAYHFETSEDRCWTGLTVNFIER